MLIEAAHSIFSNAYVTGGCMAALLVLVFAVDSMKKGPMKAFTAAVMWSSTTAWVAAMALASVGSTL